MKHFHLLRLYSQALYEEGKEEKEEKDDDENETKTNHTKLIIEEENIK